MKTLKWGLLYTAAFLAAFVGSALLKMNSDPTHGKYNTRWDETVGKAYTDLPYGEGAANKFDLYVPADKSQDAYGLVVYLHAGGFTGGDKAEDAEMLEWLCSKGYVAAGINYTLFTEENPDASVYSQSEEIKAAMPYVVAAAEKLGYKLDRMAISGGSAGGCLALLYAYRDADTSPLPVRMVFEAVGPGSFHVEDWGIFGLDQSPAAAAGLFSVMSGQALTPEDIASGAYLEAVKPISADRWVTKDTVPSVLCYGAYDKMQPFAASKPLVAALEKNGVDHRHFVAEHSGHGLQNDNKAYFYRMYRQFDWFRYSHPCSVPGNGDSELHDSPAAEFQQIRFLQRPEGSHVRSESRVCSSGRTGCSGRFGNFCAELGQ